MRESKKEVLFFGGVLLVCTALLAHLFFSTELLLRGSDQLFHLNRIEGLKEGLLAGQLPVRIYAFQFNGYGSPEGIFYPDLFLYIPALLRMAGVSYTVVYHSLWIAIIFLGVFVSWYAFCHWLRSPAAGALAAVLFNTVYMMFVCQGTAVGQQTALIFWPLAFYALWTVLYEENGEEKWPLLLFSAVAIFQAHIINAGLFVLGAAAVCALSRRQLREKSRRQAVIMTAGLGLLLNLWRLVPFFYFYRNMDFWIKHPERYFLPFDSLSYFTCSFSGLFREQFWLSIPVIVLSLFFVFVRLKDWRSNKLWYATFFWCALLCAGTWQGFPWQLVERLPVVGAFLPKLQFSFRFIPLGTVFLVLFLGRFCEEFLQILTHRWRLWMAGLCIASSLCGVWTLHHWELEMGKFAFKIVNEYAEFTTLPSTKHAGDYLYSDIRFDKLKNHEGQIPQANDYYTAAVIKAVHRRGNTIDVSYQAAKGELLQVPLFYYPGYRAVLEDGRELEIRQTGEHFLQVLLPPGEHRVHVWYSGLWFFRLADVISLVAFVWLVWYLGRGKRYAPGSALTVN